MAVVHIADKGDDFVDVQVGFDDHVVRAAQAQVRQALYEGLLATTAEEQKKRKSKKAEVDENQLSIFGFAA